MLQLQPVVWTRGLLLDPQHLQAQDRYVESQLAFRMRAVRSHAWGVTCAIIDDAALEGGMCGLRAAAGIMPDGLLFDTRAADALPMPRPLAALLPRDAHRALVHLAVPAWRRDARNVAPPDERTTERFLLAWADRADDANAARERPVPLATAHLQLVAEHEAREGYASIPVACLVRTPDGRIARDDTFVPPLLHLDAAPSLVGELTALVDRLAAVAVQLSAQRRERHHDVAEYSALDLSTFWTLFTINSHLPVLQHRARSGATHPAELCVTLSTLATALRTVDTDGPRDPWPPYDHVDPASALRPRMAAIEAALDALVPRRGATVPLSERSPGIWVGVLPDDWRGETDALYLAVTADGDPALARRVPLLCKIAAADQADALVRHALPGAPLAHVLHPPDGVAVRIDCEYFAVARDNAAWTRISRTRDVAIYLPHDLSGARCTLIALGA
jgi:type VI secretion system protein ImpJ